MIAYKLSQVSMVLCHKSSYVDFTPLFPKKKRESYTGNAKMFPNRVQIVNTQSLC